MDIDKLEECNQQRNDRKNLFLLLVLNTLYHLPKSITYAFALQLQSRGASLMDQVSFVRAATRETVRGTADRPIARMMTVACVTFCVVGEIQLGNLSGLVRPVVGANSGYVLRDQDRPSKIVAHSCAPSRR